MNKLLSIAALGAVLLAAPAGATERPVDERRPLKADARVSVSNVAGRISVEAWDRNELHLTGHLSAEVEALEITGSESSLQIEVRLPKRTRNVEETVLHLRVPAGISLDATGVSADITARGLSGPVKANSVSGDVRLEVASRRIEAQSVSGDVTVEAPVEEVRVQSVSGDVTVRGGKGALRTETVSGDVHVSGARLRSIDAESVSGDLHFDVTLESDNPQVKVETLSGEVRFTVRDLPDVELELGTFSGDLSSNLLPDLAGKRKYSREGKAKGRIRLHSFSGDVELKKK